MEIGYYSSPIGILEIICECGELISLKLVDKFDVQVSETELINNIKSQLDEYFSGKRQKFSIKVNPKGTQFQKLVWNELQKIPYGKTKSYAEIAHIIGNENAQRAVGSACNKNPVMIVIPCHRVILKSAKIGGFAHGSLIKQKLLETEKCV